MPGIPWFERAFPQVHPPELGAILIERLSGLLPRVREKIATAPAGAIETPIEGAWSVKEHLGHLDDLEELWTGRIDDLLEGKSQLRPADLTNRKTHEAGHDATPTSELVERLAGSRKHLLERLRPLATADFARTALHPRLEQPMRLVDLLAFVADHDDHHLSEVTALLSRFPR